MLSPADTRTEEHSKDMPGPHSDHSALLPNSGSEPRHAKKKRRIHPLALPDAVPIKRISTPAGQRLNGVLHHTTTLDNFRDPSQARVQAYGSSSQTRDMSTNRYLTVLSEEDEDDAARSANGKSKTLLKHLGGVAILKTNSNSGDLAEKGEFGSFTKRKCFAWQYGKRKVALIAAVSIALLIGLIVGLVLGLQDEDDDPLPSEPSARDDEADLDVITTSTSFPTGTYSIVTYLDSVRSKCRKANRPNWTCYPYTTFDTSPSEALTVFNWKIEEEPSLRSSLPSSLTNYTISSTPNPFALEFSSSPLVLVDEGAESEHLLLQISLEPAAPPGNTTGEEDNSGICASRQNLLRAMLYTRRERGYPYEVGDIEGTASFPLWPYAVRIEQIVSDGESISVCSRIDDGGVQNDVMDEDYSKMESNMCGCVYQNYREI